MLAMLVPSAKETVFCLAPVSVNTRRVVTLEKSAWVTLLDWMMLEMDGRATLQALRSDPATCKIPVILVTAKAQSPDGGTFAGVEVAAIFAKPLRPLKLADQIRQVLG